MKDSFKDLTQEECIARQAELSRKLQRVRFDMVVGHVENPLEKRVLRRQIARLNTLIGQHAEGKR